VTLFSRLAHASGRLTDVRDEARTMRTRLIDRFAKAAKANGRKSPFYMDDEVIGFGIQVRQTSRKCFTSCPVAARL
jgi:hypothetical protein